MIRVRGCGLLPAIGGTIAIEGHVRHLVSQPVGVAVDFERITFLCGYQSPLIFAHFL
jgi:hypothetical protein